METRGTSYFWDHLLISREGKSEFNDEGNLRWNSIFSILNGSLAEKFFDEAKIEFYDGDDKHLATADNF